SCSGKLTGIGARLSVESRAMPVPTSATDTGPASPCAVCATLSTAVRAPAPPGVKATGIWQESPGTRVRRQSPADGTKSPAFAPAAVTEVMVSLLGPVFVQVTGRVSARVPWTTGPKSSGEVAQCSAPPGSYRAVSTLSPRVSLF